MPAPEDPTACPPCRGTGSIIATRQDGQETITCPWCNGSGKRPEPASGAKNDD